MSIINALYEMYRDRLWRKVNRILVALYPDPGERMEILFSEGMKIAEILTFGMGEPVDQIMLSVEPDGYEMQVVSVGENDE